MAKLKRFFILFLLICLSVVSIAGCKESGQEEESDGVLKVISYNVLVDWGTIYEGTNTGETKTFDFASRSVKLIALINKEKPDSIGFQEASLAWKQALKDGLEGYGYVGTMDTGGENDTGAFGTFIFYRTDKYKAVETENFWLSKTPEKTSAYPGADRPRNGAWVILEDKETGKKYAHVNVHVEWKTKASNSFGATLTRQKTEELAARGLPVFCTGDFNIEPDYEAAELMTTGEEVSIQNSQEIAKTQDNSKFTHFDVTGRPIDYIFVTEGTIEVESYRTIGDYTLSDHLGVSIEAVIR